jgi:hypothetical protein
MRSGEEFSTCGINVGTEKVLDFGVFQILGFWVRDAQLVLGLCSELMSSKSFPNHFTNKPTAVVTHVA